MLQAPVVGRYAGYPNGLSYLHGSPTREEVRFLMGHPLSGMYPPLDGPPPAVPVPANSIVPVPRGYVPRNQYAIYHQPPMVPPPGQMNGPAGFDNHPGSVAPSPAAPLNQPSGGYPPQAPLPPIHGYGANVHQPTPAPAKTIAPAPAPAANTPTQPATLSSNGNFSSWRGYPGKGSLPIRDLSCHEVCQRYPNALNHGVLDAFLQRNWSAGEVVQSMPADIRAALVDRRSGDNPTWLTNRMRKRTTVLVQNNQWDPMIRDAQAGRFLRADGRPYNMKRWKSARPAELASALQNNHDILVSKRANATSRRSGRVAALADGGSADSVDGGSSSHTNAGGQADLGEDGQQNGDRMEIDDTEESESEDVDDDEDDPDWGA